jgi:hypothetical protein
VTRIQYEKLSMVLLGTKLVKKFLEMIKVDFRKTRGNTRRNGIPNCIEIIIAKIVIVNLSDFIM